MTTHYDAIVIGTGPGGAPVAMELAKAGKKVCIIERGAYHKKLLGFPFGMRILERFFIFNRSKEGVLMERAFSVGGSSMIYQGNVFPPTESFMKKLGINIGPEADEIMDNIGVRELPDEFYHRKGSTGLQRLMEAAEAMGAPFEAQKKFVNPDLCKKGCDWCMLGCSTGAKWTTRHYIDRAVNDHNAVLMTSSMVDRILFNKNRADGIVLKNGKVLTADIYIMAAGGIGTPGILLRSGMEGVGKRFFMDPMVILYGMSSHKNGGMYAGQTFTHAIESYADDHGFMIGNNQSFGTWLVMSLMRIRPALQNFYRFPFIKRGVGLFVKLAEDDKGEIYKNERTSKPMTENDVRRMKVGTDIARELMIKSGVKEKSITALDWAGGHPGGTVSMGKFVDRGFRTQYDNLYICDASVFPESPGSPPSLSIMAMSRLLSKYLLGKEKVENRQI